MNPKLSVAFRRWLAFDVTDWLTLFLLLGLGRLCAQTVTSFSPPVGSVGEAVTIFGDGFYPGTVVVKFHGVRDPTAQPASTSVIYAHVPVGATTGPITVQVDNNSASSADDFVVIGPGPFITDFSPMFAAVDDSVVIYGFHFSGTTAVKFHGTSAGSFLPNADGTQISVFVPAGATTGPISVTTPFGTSNGPSAFTVIGPGAYITGFAPAVGNVGTTVLIDGAHFMSATGATFNGRAGANFFVQSDARIQVDAPPGVTTGPIAVLSPLGNYTSTNFFVPPVIRGFSPVTGRAGTNVVLTGTNFTGAASVSFGGVLASFIVLSNAALQAAAPAGASSGPLRINTPAGSFITTTNFKFLPLLTGFAPAFGPPAASVVLSGANLNEGLSAVKFNDVSAAFGVASFGQIMVTVPATATTGPISVTTSNGTFTTSDNFFLPPDIAGFSPTTGAPGAKVAITGVNFVGASAVSFAGVPASFNVTNNNSLGAIVPEGAITGPISITTPAGTASTGAQLFYGAPRIYSFAPTHGLPGTNVIVTGTNFLGASVVRFNGINASTFNVVDNGTIQASVPANVLTGPIAVTAPGGTTASTNDFVIDFISNLSLSMAAAPDPVFWASNLVYSLLITNNGPFSAPNVRVTDILPASVILKSAVTTQGSVSANGNTLTGALGAMAVSSSVTLTLTVLPQALGTITNQASVTSDYPDPTPADNSGALASTVLPLPLLAIQPYAPNQWQISWPAALIDYVLQFKTQLTTNVNWSNLPTPPIVSGTNRFVIEAGSAEAKFYRLKQ